MRIILLLSALSSGALAGVGHAQNQAKDKKTKEATYKGKMVRQWIEILKSKDSRERNRASQALISAAKDAVPALIGALKDKDRNVRYSAAFALGKIGPAAKKAEPALIGALKDKDGRVRYSAAFALGQIGPVSKDAMPALITALEDKDKRVRYYTAVTLGKIGPAAKDAVPALTAMSKNDSHAKARKAAAAALKKISAKPR